MQITSGLAAGQVLQRRARGATADLVGTCATEGEVALSVLRGGSALRGWSRRVVGAARNGAFTARIDGLPVGGPYRLTLSVGSAGKTGREQVTVKDVFVGDVWVLAGQSNMQGVGNLDRAPRPHAMVRACTMDGRWALAREPLHHMDESPDAVHNPGGITPEAAARSRALLTKGVTVGVTFGAEMAARTSVPQGLICTAHGGTSMEQWDPAKKDLGGGSLYGSMLRSVRATGQGVAGVLWYQGESDTGPEPAAVYSERMRALVAAMRADFGSRTLPFLMVQIGRFVRPEGAVPRWWNAIQEQQRRLKKTIKHLECVPAVDLQLDDLIHIGSDGLRRLGVRLARVADLVAHGSREAPTPEPLRIRRLAPKECRICAVAYEITFANVVGGLRSAGEPTGFALVDRQHRVVDCIYKTVLDGDRVIVETSLAEERGDVSMMYGHGENPYVNITDQRDMAVPVFGPLPIEQGPPSTGFLTSWLVGPVRPSEAIIDLPRPDPEGAEARAFAGSFVDMHDAWTGRSGHAAFFATLRADEDMSLELRLGYDGPIRVWLGEDEVVTKPTGTNPAVIDAVVVKTRVAAGTHRLTVVMALNGGLAWGFFLRFSRTGLDRKALAAGEVRMPVVTAETTAEPSRGP